MGISLLMRGRTRGETLPAEDVVDRAARQAENTGDFADNAPAWGCAPELFVLGRIEHIPSDNPFADTQRITLAERRLAAPTVDVFAADPARVLRWYDADTDRAIYMLGHAAHPAVTGNSLLRRAAEACVTGDAEFLRAIVGVFVLIVDDRRLGRVSFCADALGVRPWFVGEYKKQLTAGTDVLGLCKAGLSKGQVNYDAVATWLVLNQPLGNDTVVKDYAGLAPGTVATFDNAGRSLTTHNYGGLTYADEPISTDELAERQHAVVGGVLDTLLQGIDETHLLLSGGFDSRLLAALMSRRPGVGVRMTTLATRIYETPLAQAVADALGRPLEVVPSRPRIADFFDEPFSTTPQGFMTGLNLTNVLARKYPTLPTLCGYMGDGTMRGSVIATSTHFAQEKAGLSQLELAKIITKRFTLPDHRLNLLHERVRHAVHERAIASACNFLTPGIATGKPLIYADLYARHRLYFAGNILQPLAMTEPIAPLCAWAIADLRTRYPQSVYGKKTYPILFQRFFPELAHIPHSYDIDHESAGKPKPPTPSTRHRRRWGARLAASAAAGRLQGACPLKTVGRIAIDAFRVRPFEEKELTFLYKLQLFEKTLHQAGIQFNWRDLC